MKGQIDLSNERKGFCKNSAFAITFAKASVIKESYG